MNKHAAIKPFLNQAKSFLARQPSNFGGALKFLVPKTPKGKALAAGGVAAGGLGIGVAAVGAKKIGPIYKSFGADKKTVEYADKTKTRLRWHTYPGGPVIEGPVNTMKELFQTGQMDRKRGLIMLAKLLKQKILTIVGKV